MNQPLLERVRARILEFPGELNMYNWGTWKNNHEINQYLDGEILTPEVVEDAFKHRCGTAACIGGWAILLHMMETKMAKVDLENATYAWDYAQSVVQLDNEQANRLFFTEEWPPEIRGDYDRALALRDFKAAATIAVERIDLFIKTGGRR